MRKVINIIPALQVVLMSIIAIYYKNTGLAFIVIAGVPTLSMALVMWPVSIERIKELEKIKAIIEFETVLKINRGDYGRT